MNSTFTSIGTVRIPVSDVTKSVKWYRERLGLTLIRSDDHEAELNVYGGGTTVTLYKEVPTQPLGVLDDEGWTTVFNLRTLDPAATRSLLNDRGCETYAWLEGKYVTIFQINDPDGNRLGLCYERLASPYYRETPWRTTLLDGVNALFVPVCDLEQSLEWYTNMLGFTVTNRWNNGADLRLGEEETLLTLLVYGDSAQVYAEKGGVSKRAYFCMLTDDLQETHRQLRERNGRPTDIVTTRHQLSCEITDPSGIRIAIASRVPVMA